MLENLDFMKTNFKTKRKSKTEIDKEISQNDLQQSEKEITQAEFEEFIIKSGA